MKTKYLLLALILLITEILIAIYAHDKFIRPFFGDFLAVIFVYCCLMIFLSRWPLKVALSSLLIAYLIETLQYFKFIEITGLIKYKVLAILIGNSFSWLDILAYTIGFITILIVENRKYWVLLK
ncbi:DUF2809 domain-containing protein [Lacihabitans sp. LS3-19]|uniref:ribosomal maturation YjgA family protein n=1 Tax=Lacihabitans sp. LS3-19 TaxID=2487335 RepID=UPI0020CF05D5|nr:DUF2809 domain-containing protein [Lacihabitans sp. LS3-19]MCP9767105.1 DUF2809 domain-containing protein [Lacihabitans sp. LS3-19]